MATWRNWSGKLSATPSRIHHLRSEADAVALVKHASSNSTTIRTAGAAHSHTPLLPTSGVIVDTSGLSGVISTDRATKRAWVWAGTPIYALGRPLHDAGLALDNQGDIDRQSIAGAVATGTHGTGVSLTNLSAMVTGAQVVLASGELVRCSATHRPDLWQVAQLNLGALGIVTRLELQLRDAYRLRQQGWTEHIDSMLSKLDDIVHQSRHFEFFWYPTTGECVAKATVETDEPAEYPVGPEGDRCAWSYEVLPNHRTWPHTEMEYSVAMDQGPACLAAIADLLATRFVDMAYPIEYRTVCSDEVWMSTAYRRPTVTISVHMSVDQDDEPLFRACEEVFVAFDARPHWGKVHYRTSAELAAMHARWGDWWRVRDEHDPGGVFLNSYLRQVRGS